MLKRACLRVCLFLLLSPLPLSAQNYLNGPEDMEFDTIYNRWLVTSNFNGIVAAVDSNGVQSIFNDDNWHVSGLAIVDSTVWVSTDTDVRGIDITSGIEHSVVAPPVIGRFDGLICDDSGFLYLADTGGRIIKIRISDLTYSIFTDEVALQTQTFVYDDENNRLLVVAYEPKAPIRAISMSDSTVSIVLDSTAGLLDGIAQDHEDNIYISSQADGGAVWMYDRTFTAPPVKVFDGFTQPTGTNFSITEKILAVAGLNEDSVAFIPFESYHDTDKDNTPDVEDNCPEVFNRLQENSDGDEFGDACDNCDETDNPDQIDSDSDGFGDACDLCAGFDDNDDFDADTVPDSCDNCPEIYNPDQADADDNDIGDVCDGCCLPPTVGDIDQSGIVDISDVQLLIDNQFLTLSPLVCESEGDLDISGVVDITDIQILIDNQFITLTPLSSCP